MKFHVENGIKEADNVSTLVVEWIEIRCCNNHHCFFCVSTLVVEWIEMQWIIPDVFTEYGSPPSWWSGLKSPGGYRNGIQS